MLFFTLSMLSSTVTVVRCQNQTTPSTPSSVSTTAQVPTNPTPTPAPVPLNTDIGECTCDLTVEGCDVNCCCDTDCTDDDRRVFSQCDDAYSRVDNQACIQSSVVFNSNIPNQINTTVPGIFCVYTDNYQQRNYYVEPEYVTTEQKISDYENQYGGHSYKTVNTEQPISTLFYKSGDPIYTIHETDAFGYLSLPNALTSAICNDNNPTAYLYDQTFTCSRLMNDLPSDCTNSPAINARTYYEGFKVVRNPSLFGIIPQQNITEASVNETVITTTVLPPLEDQSLYNSTQLVPVSLLGPHLCIDKTGFNRTCTFTDIPSPSYVFDNQSASYYCQNTVTKITYTVEYSANSTLGIVLVSATFTFTDVDGSLTDPISQMFESRFLKEGMYNPEARSGNPGYVVGNPVMAGRYTERQDPDRGPIGAIEVDTDNRKWLTMLTSSIGGDCVQNPNNRVSVTFDQSMRSGCFIRVSQANVTQCQFIQDLVLDALRDVNINRVARFGNTNVTTTGDWVPILELNPPTGTPTSDQFGCPNIVLSMHMEIVYANVGALGNPQAMIIGAARRYSTQDIRFQCIGPYCQPGGEDLTQPIEVVSSVSFIDASQRAEGVNAQPPPVAVRLPDDFFYPFA